MGEARRWRGAACSVAFVLVLAPCAAYAARPPVQATLHDLEQLHRAIDRHFADTNEWPQDVAHVGVVTRMRAPEVPLSQGDAVDAWGNRYVYHLHAPGADPAYEIYSIGKDGIDEAGGGDDVVSRQTIDVKAYPELYKPALELFPVALLLVFGPIAWAAIRMAKRATR